MLYVRIFYAVKGQGAFMNDIPLCLLNKEQRLINSIVVTGFAYFKGGELKKTLLLLERVLNESTDVVRFGSAALDLCHIAAGRIGVYYESGLKPWDCAAGVLIVQEVGGIVTNFNNDVFNIFQLNNHKFAIDILSSCNKSIHAKMQNILN